MGRPPKIVGRIENQAARTMKDLEACEQGVYDIVRRLTQLAIDMGREAVRDEDIHGLINDFLCVAKRFAEAQNGPRNINSYLEIWRAEQLPLPRGEEK